ncbi:MAG: ROK family protein [Acidimicrobiia bacterium]|nr:ROK family protein [Acidimicrobiia bacterium]
MSKPERITAALDVGGTSIKAGVVRDAHVDLLPIVPSHSQGPAEVVLAQLVGALDAAITAAGPGLDDVAIAVPRPFDLDRGVPLLRGLHKFESIHGLELPSIFRLRTAVGDRPIRFVGDAEAAGIGEARCGAGRGFRRVLTITLGTGMGACLTDDAQVVSAVDGLVVEDLHDRTARDARGRGRRADDAFSARGLATALGAETDGLESAVADPANTARLVDFGSRLGEFLAPVLDELQAEVAVIAGGLAVVFDRFAPAIGPRALQATLGTRGPLLGAAALTAAAH